MQRAIIIGSERELHLVGTVVEVEFHSMFAHDVDNVALDEPLYSTYPPLFMEDGAGPVLFLQRYLAILPPDVEEETEIPAALLNEMLDDIASRIVFGSPV